MPPATAPRRCAVETALLTRPADLDGLAGAGWDSLVEAMPRPTPFLLSAWMRAWWDHYGSPLDLAVHVARRDDRIVAGLPLAVGSTFPGTSVARFVGAPDSTLADVVAAAGADATLVRSIVAAAVSEHGLLHLFTLAPDGHLAAVLAPCRMHRRSEAPVMSVQGSWNEMYAANTSRKRRSLHRRRWRRLRELGDVDVTVACAGTELERALEEAFRLHALRWAGRPDVSTFGSERGRSFNRTALAALGARGQVRLVTLRVAGRPIAFTCSLFVAGRTFVYRLAFDPAFAEVSPGVLATLEAVRVAVEDGTSRIEFLRGAERYKLELADRVESLHEAFLGDHGVRQTFAGHALHARTGLRRTSGAWRRRGRTLAGDLARRTSS